MNIQFNDEATTLFEYPSEESLLDDQENGNPEEASLSGVTSPALPNPFGKWSNSFIAIEYFKFL